LAFVEVGSEIIFRGNLKKMENLNRHQLPDSSSSPPISIFHGFEDEGMSDLPSCVYANPHQHHQQHIPMNNLNAFDAFINVRQDLLHHEMSHAAPQLKTTQVKGPRQKNVATQERKRTLR
jgi:hypothetical protein